jgi:hypothetical protein
MTKQDKTATLEAESPEAEMAALDKQIRDMEAELQEETSTALSWEEVTSTTAENLARKEHRRAILPRLISAARIKRAELRIQRERRAAEPLEALRAEAFKEMEDAEARYFKAIEERNLARGRWSDTHGRLEKIGRRIKDSEREIAELKGER